MIIDAQIHCWKETPQYPTPEDARAKHGADYTAERAIAQMDACGVQAAILVPPDVWFTGVTKNSYSLDAAARYPGRFGTMGQFDYQAPNAAQALEHWRVPGMLGIRTYIRPHMRHYLTDASFNWFWSAMVEHDMPFMSQAPGAMSLYSELLARHPRLRLIIDHAGREAYGAVDDAAWVDLDDTLALARYENVTIKVSSMPSWSSTPYPFESLHAPLRRIFDAFGSRRMLWGSDVTRLSWGYADNLKLFTEALDFLGDDDKEWILGRSAIAACRWDL